MCYQSKEARGCSLQLFQQLINIGREMRLASVNVTAAALGA
jgi:hypothetical protein